ncbi:MAG: SIMPL domain-containing protein [Glycocaulis sp.]
MSLSLVRFARAEASIALRQRALLLATGLALAIALLAGSHASAQEAAGNEGRLSLSATGEVRLTPDMASVTAGAVTRADTASEALAANARQMAGVFRALEQAGIARRDIQTSNLSVSPVYAPYDASRGSDQRIIGYEATNTVRVTVRDLDRLGRTIDVLVNAGANRLQGVSFAHSDPAEARDEARRRAVAELGRLRALYSEAAGIRTGRMLSLSESGGYQPYAGAFLRAEAVAADVSTEVAPGEITISVQVEAVWAIEP